MVIIIGSQHAVNVYSIFGATLYQCTFGYYRQIVTGFVSWCVDASKAAASIVPWLRAMHCMSVVSHKAILREN